MNTTIEPTNARATLDQAMGSIPGLKVLGGYQDAWLPAPHGPFALALRIYWPGQDILGGKWEPAAIKKA